MEVDASVEKYRAVYPRYAGLASDVARILESFPHAAQKIHKIEQRAKSVESFREKFAKQHFDGTARYKDIHDITDLSGVRVIVFVRDVVEEIEKFVLSYFDVSEHRDVGEER